MTATLREHRITNAQNHIQAHATQGAILPAAGQPVAHNVIRRKSFLSRPLCVC
jgi:hypothetical protein